MASNRAKELWEKGVDLRNAWRAFAPPELREQFEISSGFVEALAKASQGELRPSFMMAIGEALTSAAERSKLEARMKEAVLIDLYNSELVASAYREYPSRSQNPVCIDYLKFDLHDPDWESGSFEADGIRYFRVRISKPLHASQPKAAKGSRQLIHDTIDRLCNSNPGFCQLHRKVACDEIRKSIGIEHKPGNGLSDKNLEKAILRRCGPKAIQAD